MSIYAKETYKFNEAKKEDSMPMTSYSLTGITFHTC